VDGRFEATRGGATCALDPIWTNSATEAIVARLPFKGGARSLPDPRQEIRRGPAAIEALQNASPTDVADLSEAANRLATADATFNAVCGFQTSNSGTGENAILEGLQTALTDEANAAASSASSSNPSVNLFG
jgi:hypothetical protein